MSKSSLLGGFLSAGGPGSRFMMETYELLAWRCRSLGEKVSLLWAQISLLGLIDVALVVLIVRALPLFGGGDSTVVMVFVGAVVCLGLSSWALWRKIRLILVLRRQLAAVTFQIEGPEDEW
jgi:ABC-type nickel/cobalt efflux system permease component RcnA